MSIDIFLQQKMFSLGIFETNVRTMSEIMAHENFSADERFVIAGGRFYTDFTDFFVIPGQSIVSPQFL